MHDERDVDGRSASATADSLGNNIDSWRRRAPPRQRRPKLRQLNANDVDAVFVKGEKSLNFLRDIQVIRVPLTRFFLIVAAQLTNRAF